MALSLSVVVGGCSGGKAEDKPSVATLQSAAPTTSAAVAVDDQRPLVPIDATDADIEAIARPWVKCLVEKGGSKYQDAGEWLQKGAPQGDDAKTRAMYAECMPKFPEKYEDRMRRTDIAAYKDNQREWYQCAKREGYKLTAPDPDTGQFGITAVGANGDFGSPKMEACRRAAFTD